MNTFVNHRDLRKLKKIKCEYLYLSWYKRKEGVEGIYNKQQGTGAEWNSGTSMV